jgi:hypothetical protein
VPAGTQHRMMGLLRNRMEHPRARTREERVLGQWPLCDVENGRFGGARREDCYYVCTNLVPRRTCIYRKVVQ